MQDSNLTITVKALGIQEAEAQLTSLGASMTRLTVNQNGTVSASGKLASALSQQGSATNGATNAINRASKAHENYFYHIAKTTIQSALVNKAFISVMDSAGKAVQQVDLMNNFPASMAALGLSSADATVSLKVLRDYIAGIGGDLVTATTSVARFAEVTKNVKAATAEYTGVSNALIAGGAGAEVQKNALEQLTQAYSRGKPQLIEWKSLMVAAPAQLNQVATAMGFINAQGLGEALTKGKVSMNDFVVELTRLSTGAGPIAQQAIARMQGIQYASNVMQNALTNGLAAIYTAIGRQNIISFFTFTTQVIQVLAQSVVWLINTFFSLINVFRGLFGLKPLAGMQKDVAGVASGIGGAADAAGTLGNNLGGAGAAAKALNKSLASFDKMNVLPDKTSAGGTGGGAGGGAGAGGAGSPLDASQLAGLSSAFDSIASKIKEAGLWAKIIAGAIGSLITGKIILTLIDQFNKMIKTLGEAKTNVQNLGDAIGKMGDKAKTGFGKVATAIGDSGLGKGASGMTSAVAGFIGGIAGAIGGALGPVLAGVGVAIVDALTGVLAAGAAALGVSVGVFVAIIVAAVAAIVAIIWVIWTNWDNIWKWMSQAAANVWKFLQDSAKNTSKFVTDVWSNVSKFFGDLWKGIEKFGTDAFNNIKTAVTNFFIAVAANPVVKVIIDIFTFFFDLIVAIAQIGFVLLQLGFIAVGAGVQWLAQQFTTWWNGLVTVFGVIGKWFTDRFTEAWNGIVAVWAVVVKWFTDVWNGIVAVFIDVAKWFGDQFTLAWQAIVAIWTPVIAWFNTTIWIPLINLFAPITKWFGDVFRGAWNAIVVVWSAVSGWFQGVWNGIASIFGGVAAWFGNIFTGAWYAIQTAFGHVKDFLSGLWDGIATGIRNALQTGINTIYSGMNKVGDFVNTVIDNINSLSSKVNGPQVTFRMPHFNPPRLAMGGVVHEATLAMIGEAGAEAVVPLENNLEWIDKLAAKINANGGSGQPVNLTIQIGEEKIVTKIIDLINERTQMSGRNTILV